VRFEQGDTLTIPASLAGKTHTHSEACGRPNDQCVRLRRLADLHCGYCGLPLGYGTPCVVTAALRFSHQVCVERFRDGS
jgi:coenzyme F420-reducing hydrogenase beta subunit